MACGIVVPVTQCAVATKCGTKANPVLFTIALKPGLRSQDTSRFLTVKTSPCGCGEEEAVFLSMFTKIASGMWLRTISGSEGWSCTSLASSGWSAQLVTVPVECLQAPA